MKAPESYKNANTEIKAQICNGCGPSGWKAGIIPDTVWGLCISEACNIHDWMYFVGRTEADRLQADVLFLENLNALIEEKTKWGIMKFLRKMRAKTYYTAVRKFGQKHFKH
jgi:hypothetical protein